MALGVQSRSVVESVMLIPHFGRPYGTDTSRQRHDRAFVVPVASLFERLALTQDTWAFERFFEPHENKISLGIADFGSDH